MTKLHELSKLSARTKKRLGRGRGSGKGGHTAGRGQKGQKSRGKVHLIFEGTKIKKSLLKRLPLLRGKGKLKPHSQSVVVNLKFLNLLPAGSLVDVKTLIERKITGEEARIWGVKILGEGELQVPLTVVLPVSEGAKKKIIKAGGRVISTSEFQKEQESLRTAEKVKEKRDKRL